MDYSIRFHDTWYMYLPRYRKHSHLPNYEGSNSHLWSSNSQPCDLSDIHTSDNKHTPFSHTSHQWCLCSKAIWFYLFSWSFLQTVAQQNKFNKWNAMSVINTFWNALSKGIWFFTCSRQECLLVYNSRRGRVVMLWSFSVILGLWRAVQRWRIEARANRRFSWHCHYIFMFAITVSSFILNLLKSLHTGY